MRFKTVQIEGDAWVRIKDVKLYLRALDSLKGWEILDRFKEALKSLKWED